MANAAESVPLSPLDTVRPRALADHAASRPGSPHPCVAVPKVPRDQQPRLGVSHASSSIACSAHRSSANGVRRRRDDTAPRHRIAHGLLGRNVAGV